MPRSVAAADHRPRRAELRRFLDLSFRSTARSLRSRPHQCPADRATACATRPRDLEIFLLVRACTPPLLPNHIADPGESTARLANRYPLPRIVELCPKP